MRIVSVLGTRPQLIKAAALLPALRASHEEVFVDTGQHYDDALAGTFFRELDLPRPEHILHIRSETQGGQTAAMLTGVEEVLLAERPDAVLVYGDTNSTLAGALAAAKLSIPIAHVEAGLRSFDRGMPEEVNRVVADHLSSWLFAPTPTAVANLAAEGITDGVILVGDLMQDLAARVAPEVADPDVLSPMAEALAATAQWLRLEPGRFLYATLHRAENRSPQALAAWAGLLGALASETRPVVVATHPGTRVALMRAGVELADNVALIDPLGYRSSLALQLHAAAVLTDSGGVQRESAWLGVPCLVLRGTTEWVEAVAGSSGRMVVVGLDRDRARREIERLAPEDRAADLARERAATLDLQPAGAADAIVAGLERPGRRFGPPAAGG